MACLDVHTYINNCRAVDFLSAARFFGYYTGIGKQTYFKSTGDNLNLPQPDGYFNK